MTAIPPATNPKILSEEELKKRYEVAYQNSSGWLSALKSIRDSHEALRAELAKANGELEEIGYEPPVEDPDPPICRVCLHTIRHEPICNDCAKKMCRQCGGTDHLACISVRENPTTLVLRPMKCAACGSGTGFLVQRDGKFFCETC